MNRESDKKEAADKRDFRIHCYARKQEIDSQRGQDMKDNIC
jgi:hypothetical protein